MRSTVWFSAWRNSKFSYLVKKKKWLLCRGKPGPVMSWKPREERFSAHLNYQNGNDWWSCVCCSLHVPPDSLLRFSFLLCASEGCPLLLHYSGFFAFWLQVAFNQEMTGFSLVECCKFDFGKNRKLSSDSFHFLTKIVKRVGRKWREREKCLRTEEKV